MRFKYLYIHFISAHLCMNLPKETLTYKDYVTLVEKLFEQGKSTGSLQSEAYFEYTKINLQRMKRIEKSTTLLEETKKIISEISTPLTWLVLTEGWCGDAAQNLPAIYLMSLESKNINFRLVLRDEHLEIMDKYLTNGSRSIPKLICFETESLRERFTWGPRPSELQEIIMRLKHENASKEERGLAAQNWYNKDKTLSLQKEISNLVRNL
ncbi:MAG: thioredoxin family protein [Bacteroidia bacterium]|nr:thioredoxin family protein [Bacteroidia bacterium]